ncbi:MAG: hypothetical protein K2N56_12200 [Oscillospiraceae bacterium]|nr:hypothetical protein [Oscillospiraceae bacterium]
MSKLWNSVCCKTSYYRKENKLPTPDYTTKKLSNWTYADMKREFKISMDLFSENGFSEECVFLAYRCVCLKLCFPDIEKPDISSITENVMANTIHIIEAFKADPNLKEIPTKREYERQISEYRTAATHGLVLSEEESAELSEDIKTALELLQSSGHIDKKEDDDYDEGITLDGYKFPDISVESTLRSPPPADSDERLREKLSERAYEMLTEYEREDEIIDLDFLENEFLKPNSLELTNKLREFVELYDGREYIWHAPRFFIDYPYSLNWYKGYSIGMQLDWGKNIKDGVCYFAVMQENIPPYLGPEIGSDGNIHFYGNDYWKNYPDISPLSPEEFFEREARERYKDQLLLDRRRELENKYLIPEIRTASM